MDTDEKLVNMVREGRRKEFSYFKWEGEVPDPQSESTFRQCVLSWGQENAAGKKLFDYYRHLIDFRKSRKAMKGKTLEDVAVHEEENSTVILVERSFEDDRILIAMNFDSGSAPFILPGSIPEATKLFDSSSLEWGGPGELTPSLVLAGNKTLMHPHSIVIFQI